MGCLASGLASDSCVHDLLPLLTGGRVNGWPPSCCHPASLPHATACPTSHQAGRHALMLLQSYDYHLGAVNTVTFIDEGRRFVSTSDDKTIRVIGWRHEYWVHECSCSELKSPNLCS